MTLNPFINHERRLRNGWWILIFFAVVASMLVPLVVMRDGDVPVAAQLAIVAIASVICQRLRGQPIVLLTGRPDRHWLSQFVTGGAIGAAMMLAPAVLLFALGNVRWTWSGVTSAQLMAGVPLVIAAAATEELLFRGFVFQRMIDGVGASVSQGVLAAYFVLTHSGALRGAGDLRFLAAANIFLASLLFGVAFLKTRSLAMPFGLHAAANLTQGNVLGFGVSGNEAVRLLTPLQSGPDWMTGASFGLEASVPGLLAVAATLTLVWIKGLKNPAWGDATVRLGSDAG